MNNTHLQTFSIFGSFTEIVDNIVNIAKHFPNFEKNLQNHINPQNGNVYAVYSFKKLHENINISSFRIDYIYSTDFIDDNLKSSSQLLDNFKNILEKILNNFNFSFRINRLALNSSLFFEDPNNLIPLVLLGENNFLLTKGQLNEFNLTFNSPRLISNIKFNNILSFTRGEIQNKNDFTKRVGMVMQSDFNSVVGGFSETNSFNNTINIFKDMLNNVDKQNEKLKSKLIK